jgi:phenylalanyl-tRNA synthetase beta subunit
MEVKIPYFRTDIEVEDDIVADILRINNYTNIPLASSKYKHLRKKLHPKYTNSRKN